MKISPKMVGFSSLLVVLLLSGCVEEGAGNCCPKCTDSNAVLIKAPGGECQCYSKCSSSSPHFLQEMLGDNCCTDDECTTDTTLPPAGAPCAWDANAGECTGTCSAGGSCVVTDYYPIVLIGDGGSDWTPTCGCDTACANVDDPKMCRNGGCARPEETCITQITGQCACGMYLN